MSQHLKQSDHSNMENTEIVEKIVALMEAIDFKNISAIRILAWDYLSEMDTQPDNCGEIVDAVLEMVQAKEQARMDDEDDVHRAWTDGEF